MPIKKSVLEKKWYYRISKVFFLIAPLLVGAYLFFEKKFNPFYIGGGLIAYYFLLVTVWRIFLYIVFGGLENDIPGKANTVAPAGATTGVQSTDKNSIGPIIFTIFLFICIFAVLFATGVIKLPENLLKNIPGFKNIPSPVKTTENTSNSTKTTHQYGAVCYSENKKGLYGKDGNCYTCSSGTATTNPIGNCSNGISGIYCCGISSKPNTNTNNTNGRCVPTGCGNFWRCTGYLYDYTTGQRMDIDSCFPAPVGKLYEGTVWEWNGTCRQCP